MNKVTLILTTYNRPSILEKSVAALHRQELKDVELEIIVMDDCSTDENSELAAKVIAKFPGIRYHRNPQNKGLSGSRNAGATLGNGEFILFLDDDIIVEPSYVMGHVDILASANNIATVGSLRFPPELTKDNNLMNYLSSRELRQRNLSPDFLQDLDPQYLGGGICGMRMSDYKKVNGFNETYLFYGGEDVDMGYSLQCVGVRIVYAANAKADHFDTVTIDRYRSKYIESGREGIKLMISRNPDFFKNSAINFLLPVSKKDRPFTRVAKKVVQWMLGSATENFLRSFAKLTNNKTYLFSKFLYHALCACWMYEGLRNDKTFQKSAVEYI
jgi:glycosyltransferase involved in cell wall biosynthesis